jgi:nucleolar protein 14
VLTPVAVLLGQYLAHSEVRSARDAAVGVIVATLAVRLASASKRFVPEAVAFLAGLVHASAEESAASLAGLPAHQAHQQGGSWLHLPTARASARGSTAAPETLSISRVLGTAANDPYFDSRELRAAALHTALQTLASAADSVALLPAGEALLAPARDAVDRLTRGPCGSRLAPATLAVAAAVVAAHGRAASAVHQPLQLHKRKREAIKTFNPRFEEDGFVRGRDYDIDRQRSEARNLKKQIAREAKVRVASCARCLSPTPFSSCAPSRVAAR